MTAKWRVARCEDSKGVSHIFDQNQIQPARISGTTKGSIPVSHGIPTGGITTNAGTARDPSRFVLFDIAEARLSNEQREPRSRSLFVSVTAGSQTLDDAAVGAAIKAGQSKKYDDLVSTCTAKPGMGQAMGAGLAGGLQFTGTFDVTVSAAPGRIAFMAAEAKRLNQPFSIEKVPQEIRQDNRIFVTAIPNKPSQTQTLTMWHLRLSESF